MTFSTAFAASRAEPAFDRLRQTNLFRDGGHDRWCAARVIVIGCGVLGSRLALEIVRSGARVTLIDPDIGEQENTGTQAVVAGQPKVETVAEACDNIRLGRAAAIMADVCHVGPGQLGNCEAIVDVTDDPNLALPLTLVSNGLGIPMLRMAVDGSGSQELGRVLVAHGGAGHACQICNRAEDDLRDRPRAPCLAGRRDRPPTLAGGGIASTIVGVGLLQLQRILTGNDVHLALNRELIVDLSNMQLLSIEQHCDDRCLSGHERWSVVNAKRSAADLTVEETFRLVTEFGSSHDDVTLQPWGHPLHIGASCKCGTWQSVVGTRWLATPKCLRCDQPMAWTGQELTRLNRAQAKMLQLNDRTWLELGLPDAGAMLVVHRPHEPALHLVLS